jgi:hypothetical protein
MEMGYWDMNGTLSHFLLPIPNFYPKGTACLAHLFSRRRGCVGIVTGWKQ